MIFLNASTGPPTISSLSLVARARLSSIQTIVLLPTLSPSPGRSWSSTGLGFMPSSSGGASPEPAPPGTTSSSKLAWLRRRSTPQRILMITSHARANTLLPKKERGDLSFS